MSTQKELKAIEDMLRSEDLEHFVKSETECCLCCTPLISKHSIDYLTFEVRETLDCPKCKVTLKNSTTTLH